MHASISDLTTYSRDAAGDVPKPSIGSSTTVIGNKVYFFGGKSNMSRKNYTADIYAFDLQSSAWEKVVPASSEHLTPTPRYFHSADHWNGNLVIFGGIGNTSLGTSDTQSVLCDVRFFSLADRQWLDPSSTSTPRGHSLDPASTEQSETPQDSMAPRPRFAHLSTIASNKLFILGGQDMVNEWLDDIHVYDLMGKQWIAHVSYPRNCGTYRSAVVAPELVVRDPVAEGVPTKRPDSVFADIRRLSHSTPTTDSSSVMAPHPLQANCDQLVHMPYSTEPTPEYPAHLYIYSNWNFVDVRRELETIDPTSTTPIIVNRSAAMMALTHQPPGLRFPTAHILGTHLIVGGTYLAQSYQSYSIWALDLQSMHWTRIDPGTALTTGSWSRGVLWGRTNRFVVFGNRRGNLVEDYNRRVVNWEHVAYVELESLGIYQPPIPRLLESPNAPSFDGGGLGRGRIMGLDAFDAELFADFEVLCEDGRRIKCSRMLLEDRWPWFREHRRKYVNAARRIVATQKPRSELELDMQPSLPPYLAEQNLSFLPLEDRPDPRLTPRLLRLSEPYPITKALLQYFYTYDLLTPLQHAPLVLSALLLLSSIYNLPHLGELVRHAMHRTLGPMTSVGVYDVTTLCDCQNLNIRALRIVMSSNKRAAARTGSRQGSGGSGRAPGAGGAGGAGGGGYDIPDASHDRDRSGHGGGYTSGGYASSSDAVSPRRQMGISMSMTPTSDVPGSIPGIRASLDPGQGRQSGEMFAVGRQEIDSPVTVPNRAAKSDGAEGAIRDVNDPALDASVSVAPPGTFVSQAPGWPPAASIPSMDAAPKIRKPVSSMQPLTTTQLPSPITYPNEGSTLSPPASPATIKAPAVPAVSASSATSFATAESQGLQVPLSNSSIPSPSEELGAPPLGAPAIPNSPASPSLPPGEIAVSLHELQSELSVSSSDESSVSRHPAPDQARNRLDFRSVESTVAEESSATPIKNSTVMQVRSRGRSTPTRHPSASDVSLASDDASFSIEMPSENQERPESPPWVREPLQIPAQIAAAVAAATQTSLPSPRRHSRMGFGRQSRQVADASVASPPSSMPYQPTPTSGTTSPQASVVVSNPATPGPTPPPKDTGFGKNINSYQAQNFTATTAGQPGVILGFTFPKIPRRKRSELVPASSAYPAAPPTAFSNRRPSTSHAEDGRGSGRRRSISDAGPSRRPTTSSSSAASGMSADTASSSSIDTPSDASIGVTDVSAAHQYQLKAGSQQGMQHTMGGLVEHVFLEANKLPRFENYAEAAIRSANNLKRPRTAQRGSQEIYISPARSDELRSIINGSPAFVVEEHNGINPAEPIGKKSTPSAWSRLWASSTTSLSTVDAQGSTAPPPVAQNIKSKRGLFSSSTNSHPTSKSDLLHSFVGI